MRRIPSLVVLQHGHYGSTAQLQMVEKAFERPNTTVLNVGANEGRTDHGVTLGGERLAEVIIEHVNSHVKEPHSLIFVCHSLGGLYARSALTTLAACPATAPSGPLSMLRWHAFVTLCTPHLGSRRPGGSLLKTPWRWAVHTTLRIFGQTGSDLAGLPAPSPALRDAGGPDAADLSVLEALSCPSLEPTRLLARFPHRIAVAMLDHDMSVPHAAAAVSLTAPARMTGHSPAAADRDGSRSPTDPVPPEDVARVEAATDARHALSALGAPNGWCVHSFAGLPAAAAAVARSCLQPTAAVEGENPAIATAEERPAVGIAAVVDDRREVECSARLYSWTQRLGFARITLERVAPAAWSKATAHTWVTGCRQLGITRATAHMHTMLAAVIDALPCAREEDQGGAGVM